MAGFSFSHVLLLVVCFVLYKIVSSFVAARRFKSFAREKGCKEPFDITGSSWPPGWARFRRMMKCKETGEDFLDDIITADFAESHTVKFTVFDGNTLLSTVDPTNIQALLATQFRDFEVGRRRYDAFKPLLNRSIFTSDGTFWEHSRALFRPQFSRENINDLEMTDRAANDLIAAIGGADSEGWTAGTDVLPLLYNFTLDTATDFLFGESIDSQTAATAARQGQSITDEKRAKKIADANKFVESFEIINDTLVRRIRLQSFYYLGDGLNFRKAVGAVNNFTEHFVQLATSHNTSFSSAAEREKKKNSLLNNLANQTQDSAELRNQTLAILVAGRDTTASLLGWCLIRLALHEEVLTKLRSTILRDFPENEEITFAKLKGCRYLQHFLNEVLRLHPTIPLNQRTAAKDTTLPVGGGPDQRSPIAVRKGQIVLFSVYIMQRRTDLWGLDAAEFKPERFEQRIPAWYFLPFLGGPRICLGQQFALTEASFLLVRLLQEFDTIEPVDRAEMARMKKGLGVTMWAGQGVKVRCRKARA